jgi:ribosomal protein L32
MNCPTCNSTKFDGEVCLKCGYEHRDDKECKLIVYGDAIED